MKPGRPYPNKNWMLFLFLKFDFQIKRARVELNW